MKPAPTKPTRAIEPGSELPRLESLKPQTQNVVLGGKAPESSTILLGLPENYREQNRPTRQDRAMDQDRTG